MTSSDLIEILASRIRHSVLDAHVSSMHIYVYLTGLLSYQLKSLFLPLISYIFRCCDYFLLQNFESECFFLCSTVYSTASLADVAIPVVQNIFRLYIQFYTERK